MTDLSRRRNFFLLHAIIFIWGFTAIIGKAISVNAGVLVWYRMLIALVSIGLYMQLRRISFRIRSVDWWRYFGVGMLIALHWLCFYQAIKISNVSVTLAGFSSGALFAALLEPLIYRKRVVLYEIFFALLVMLALYLVFRFQFQYIPGLLLSLLSAFFSSLFTVFNGKLVGKNSSVLISFYELGGGLLGISLYFILAEGWSFFEPFPSAADWGYLILLGLVCTSFTFVAGIEVMKNISPYTIVLSVNLEPVYGIILAYFIFGEDERMGAGFYIGTGFILLTIMLNAVFKSIFKNADKKTTST